MKRIGNLYERVFDRANVVQAVYAVCEKKKKTPLIRRVLANAEWYVDEVLQHPYIRGDYRTGIAADSASGKVRNILKPSIHDQIIHHAVIQITGEILLRGQSRYSFGAIKGKGPLRASYSVRRYLSLNKDKARWFAKLDAVKFYDHVDHAILEQDYHKLIKDKKMLRLLDSIVDSVPGPVGIPIGNLTSQFFANLYLQAADNYIKQEVKVDFEVRYMDDILLVSSNKRRLLSQVMQITSFMMGTLKLSMHTERAQPYEVRWQKTDGSWSGTFIDLCGWKHSKGVILLRKRTWKRFRRSLLRSAEHGIHKTQAQALLSRKGWYDHSMHSANIDKKYRTETIFRLARREVSLCARK